MASLSGPKIDYFLRNVSERLQYPPYNTNYTWTTTQRVRQHPFVTMTNWMDVLLNRYWSYSTVRNREKSLPLAERPGGIVRENWHDICSIRWDSLVLAESIAYICKFSSMICQKKTGLISSVGSTVAPLSNWYWVRMPVGLALHLHITSSLCV